MIDQRGLLVENCILRDNTAENVGGAIFATSTGLQLRDCRLENNSAGTRGGAVDLISGSLEMDGCSIVDNTAGVKGGGISAVDLYASWIGGSTLVGNAAPDGAAITVGNVFDECRLSASIVAWNDGGEAVAWDSTGSMPADNVDIWGNTGGNWTGNLAGQLGSDFNIEADPMFCGSSGAGWILTLATTSPCLADNNPGGVLMGAHGWGCDQPTGTPLPGSALALAAHPNPFNPAVVLTYRLESPTEVRLSVFDQRGRQVASLIHGIRSAGAHQITWMGLDDSGRSLPSGVYLAGLQAGSERSIRKLVLVR